VPTIAPVLAAWRQVLSKRMKHICGVLITGVLPLSRYDIGEADPNEDKNNH